MTRKAVRNTGPALEAVKMDVPSFMRDRLRRYGEEVNLNRAIPDLRDGLKPGDRAVLFALSRISPMPNSDRFVKAARVVGDAIGKYHPHGESGPTSSMVSMVQSATPPIIGIGNWGTPEDGASAFRYINARISWLGRSMVLPQYLAVTPHMWNYDRSERIPVALPSIYPNFLFNGVEMMGVGLRTDAPDFKPDSVCELLSSMLSGERFDSKQLTKTLKFFDNRGGFPVKSEENFLSIVDYHETGKGRVQYQSTLELDEKRRSVIIRRLSREAKLDSVLDFFKERKEVRSVECVSPLVYEIRLAPRAELTELQSLYNLVQKKTTAWKTYQSYYIWREIINQETDEVQTEFFTDTLYRLIVRWLRWRIALERDSLEYRASIVRKEVRTLEVLRLAISKLDAVFKALKSRDPLTSLQKLLGITEDEANIILNRKVRSLAALEDEKLENNLNVQREKLRKLEAGLKNPRGVVQKFFEMSAPLFKQREEHLGFNSFFLETIPDPIFGGSAEDALQASITEQPEE